jgi:hypothetical protein
MVADSHVLSAKDINHTLLLVCALLFVTRGVMVSSLPSQSTDISVLVN